MFANNKLIAQCPWRCGSTFDFSPRARGLLVAALVIMATGFQATPCPAQQGGFIEDLFRTVAEAQLQREQRRRIEAETQLNEPATQSIDPREVQVPPTIFPRGPLGNAPSGAPVTRPQINQPSSRPTSPPPTKLPPNQPPSKQPPSQQPSAGAPQGKPSTLTVRTREAAAFVENLVKFNSSAESLVEELRRSASTVPAIRPHVPDAYRVTADTRALLGRCNGLSTPQTLLEPYCDLDSQWRQLSFALRSLDGLSPPITQSIRQCDQVCSLMAKQLGVQPQFDREQLRGVMVMAATYMQALMDDLTVASAAPGDREGMIHDVRLLRQQLLAECDNVHDASYETVVSRFTDFVGRWQRLSAKIAIIRDPHVQMRLDRISECGADTYALMWMPPPSLQIDLRSEADRLHKACGRVLDQLTVRAMVSLPREEQARIVDASRQLDDQCRQLVELAGQRASARDLGVLVVNIDSGWNRVRGMLVSLPSVDRNAISDMDRVCGALRQSIGGGGASAPATMDYDRLLAVAASLEGSTEYFRADLQRYERYMQPASYRDSLTRSTVEMHEAAKQLHWELSRRSDLPAIQRPADTLVHAFDRLSHDLEDVERHGLTGSRAATIRKSHAELMPLVAQMAAALLDH